MDCGVIVWPTTGVGGVTVFDSLELSTFFREFF
jgi:hypothetical protein